MTTDKRWKGFTTEELHAIALAFDVADGEAMVDHNGPALAIWRAVWDELDSRGAWAGYQGFERP
jgi:hypothetical protein